MPQGEYAEGLTRLAKQHFGVALALIVRTGAHEPRLGLCGAASCADRGSLLCEATVGDDAMLVIPDISADTRWSAHPLALHDPCMRFYAACPLVAANGSRIGVFCLADDQPREFDRAQRAFLQDLARVAAIGIERERAEAQRLEAYAALREREKIMALALAGSGTGIWDRNAVTGEIRYSPGWKAILGYAETELSSQIDDAYKRVHPDDLAYVQAAIQAHFEQKTPSYEVEHRIRCKDGSYKWISSRGKVVSRDSDGRALRMIGTTTDITALRSLSERLQQSVDLITGLTDEVPGLVFQYRQQPTGKSFFSYVSAGISDIYELSAEQVAASDAAINAVIHPDDLPIYLNSLRACAASLTPWHLEYRVQLPHQGLRWRQGDARPRRLEDGGTLWYGFITDATERKRIEAELQEFATIDFLTQLPNRRHFMAQVETELAHIRRAGSGTAAILMCDLDHFKSINDKWGHGVGDLALKHFATILRAHLRNNDMAGRVGGEEFAVVMRGAHASEAAALAQQVQQQLAQAPLIEGGRRIMLTVSIGIATMSETDASADCALSRGDLELYRAKKHGRNRIEGLGALPA